MGGERAPSTASPADPTLVRAAWDAAARGYRAYWSPRFRPYLERAVAAFEPLPAGPLAVPGCGPGEEVLLLSARYPGRSIFAVDASPEMVAILRAALRERGATEILATTGPADALSDVVRQAAGVLSCFALQLLLDPGAALADWRNTLRSGAVMTVLFWPRPGQGTAHERLSTAREAQTGEARPDWEPRLLADLPHLGLKLERNDTLALEMEHASPEEYFDALVDWGPLQVMKCCAGEAAIARCRAEWLRDHGLERKGERWVHSPEARLWTLRRLEGVEEAH